MDFVLIISRDRGCSIHLFLRVKIDFAKKNRHEQFSLTVCTGYESVIWCARWGQPWLSQIIDSTRSK